MHFLVSTMSVVYALNTPIPDDGDDATIEQIRRRNKWENDDYVCRSSFSMIFIEQYNELLGILGRFTQHKMNMDEAIQVSCIIDKLPLSWKDFKHTLKHKNEELTLAELGSHERIKESLTVQDSDKPKGNNVVEFVRFQRNLADHLTNGLAKDMVLKSIEGMGLKSNLVTEC
ncbi:hypothetical protein Tco_0134658 [Tanacetum coccineum]